MRNRQLTIFILLLWLVSIVGLKQSVAQKLPKDLLRAIKNGDTSTIKNWIREDNRRISLLMITYEEEASPIWLALDYGKPNVVKLFLELGSSPYVMVKGTPLLICAAEKNDLETVINLIEAGVDPNVRDPDGLTAVHWAVIKRSFPMLVKLYESGASLLLKDKKGRLPLDYLKADHLAPFRDFINTRSQIQLKAENWPKEKDGPYVYFGENGLEVISMRPFHSLFRLERRKLSSNSFPLIINYEGFKWPLVIHPQYEQDSSSLPMPQQMFAVGDIHGNVDDLIRLLQAAGVVDSLLRWTFGEGYLVFLGDFTDRGEKVTELLWLVLYLRHQASIHGGKVLAVLGNHDMMSMLGDHRYLHPKYQRLCEYFGLDYWALFDKDSELGRYLRSLPVMLKIGDNLFVHAGISEAFLRMRPVINTVNSAFYQFNSTFPPRLTPLMDFLLRENGPLWFRGMIPDYDFRQQGYQKLVDSVASWFGVSRIIIGHSEVPQISPVFNGKIIPVNVPFNREAIIPQGLLWRDGVLYIVDIHGTIQRLMQ